MNAVPPTVKATRLPQVNLLPPEVGERRAAARRRIVILAGLGAFLILLAGGYAVLQVSTESVKTELDDAQARQTFLNSEIAKLSEVETVEKKLANAASVRKYVGSREIIYADFWPIIVNAFPEGTNIEQLLLETGDLGIDPDPDANVFAPADIGSLTFTVVLPSYESAADVEAQLNDVDIFQYARVQTVAQAESSASAEGGATPAPTADGYYRLTGTVRINYLALSLRFSDEWYGIDGKKGTEGRYLDLLEQARALSPDVATEPSVSPSPEPTAEADADANKEEN